MSARVAFCGLLLLAQAYCCDAQEISATILGTVTDTSGAAIAGATITVINADQEIVLRKTVTSFAGQYVVPLLPVARYNVSATAPGLQTAIESGIPLGVDERRVVNFTLRVESVSKVITVTADPLQVNLQSATAATSISGEQIRELAISTRNYAQLVALQPGVAVALPSDQLYVGVTSLTGGVNAMAFAVNGARFTQNNWTLDGADNVDRGSNQTLLTYPSIDSIAELNVLRGNYEPEFGRGAGGQIHVITRSGSNAVHGSAYEFVRNEVLEANNFFNNLKGLARPPLRYNNFGFTVGGPIALRRRKTGKTFFFFSQEWRRVIDYTRFTSARIPTALELRGHFTTPVCTKPIIDPVTQLCTGPVTTQISEIDPTAAAYVKDIFSQLPAPGADGTISFSGRNSFNFREESLKVDQIFNARVSAFFKYTHDTIPTKEPGGLGAMSNLPGVANTKTNAPGAIVVAHLETVVSPHLVNETGYSYSHGAVLSQPLGLVNTTRSRDIRPDLPFENRSGRVPDLAFKNGESLFGFGPYRDLNTNHSGFDSIAWLSGAHAIKFGAVYHHYEKEEGAFSRSDNGLYSFSDVGPAGSSFEQEWANFLLGNVGSFFQSAESLVADVRANQVELYGQDQYRAKPNLTFLYGLRWSFFRQPTDGHGRASTFDPGAYDAATAPSIDIHTGLLAPDTKTPVLNGIIIGGQNSPFGSAIARQNNRNLGPRVGFAWDPFFSGKTSLRGGYGIFVDAPYFGQFEGGVFTNPPFVQSVTVSNTTLSAPGSVTADLNLSPQALAGTEVRWKQPYAQQWNLDVQRQLSANTLLDVGYYGNTGLHLVGMVDINQPLPGAYLTQAVLAQGPVTFDNAQLLNFVRPYRGYGAINISSPRFRSNYHSFQAQFQWRGAQGNSVVLNYTWSHALSDAPSQYTTPQNDYDVAAEYGPSELDRRHIFTGAYIYHLPFYRERRGVTGHLLGGWELSGIVYAQSGQWLTINGVHYDPAGLGLVDFASGALFNARPDQLGNANARAPHTVQQWFDSSLFMDPPAQGVRPGNAARGSVLGPGAWRWDASLFKNIKIREHVGMQLRAEATNVLNHTNFDTVATNFLFDPRFGQVASARDPRIIQLGIKVDF